MTELKIRPLRPDAVTVVCCCDRNFLAPMGVLLRSVMDRAGQDRFYDLICPTMVTQTPSDGWKPWRTGPIFPFAALIFPIILTSPVWTPPTVRTFLP